ncbi:hypothetical protein [Sediminimonas qiaohouensis]|nr:hypothetical protein [Sediminimonas qiaohouensis]
MSKTANALFLERRSYRQRRLMDALRLLPLLGAVLWAVPLLWGQPEPAASAADGTGSGGMPTSHAMLYIFGVWAVLAILALCLSLRLDRSVDKMDAPGGA